MVCDIQAEMVNTEIVNARSTEDSSPFDQVQYCDLNPETQTNVSPAMLDASEEARVLHPHSL